MRQKGLPATLEEIKKQIATRDKLDREREVGPLQAAPDAICIDTTALSPEEVVDKIIQLCTEGREG